MQCPETGPLAWSGSAWHVLEKRLFRHCFNMGKTECGAVTRADQTAWSGRLNFALHLGYITGQCRVQKRERWLHELEKRLFRHWFKLGKIREEAHENSKNCKTWVQFQADISTTRCPIGTGQTRMSQGETVRSCPHAPSPTLKCMVLILKTKMILCCRSLPVAFSFSLREVDHLKICDTI